MFATQVIGNAPVSPACFSVRLDRDVTIYHQGDVSDYWYEVCSGVVRIVHYNIDGRRQVMSFALPGDVFGMDEAQRYCAAETVAPVTLLRHALPSSSSHQDRRSPLWQALSRAEGCLTLLGYRGALERVSAFLLHLLNRSGGGWSLELPMSRADIADHLGLTMHTVSRSISQLARLRVIALDGPQHLMVLDRNRLRAITQGHGPDGAQHDLAH